MIVKDLTDLSNRIHAEFGLFCAAAPDAIVVYHGSDCLPLEEWIIGSISLENLEDITVVMGRGEAAEVLEESVIALLQDHKEYLSKFKMMFMGDVELSKPYMDDKTFTMRSQIALRCALGYSGH